VKDQKAKGGKSAKNLTVQVGNEKWCDLFDFKYTESMKLREHTKKKLADFYNIYLAGSV